MPTTLPWITLAAGLLLIIVGLLGGGIEIKEVKIPPVPPIPRAASFIVGCVLSSLILYPIFLQTFLQTPTEPQNPTELQKPEAPELGAAIKRHLIEVRDVKMILRHLGMYTGTINNDPTDEYFTAVANFQHSRNLAVQDGLVGGETFPKLRDAWPEYPLFASGNIPAAIPPTSSNSASNVPALSAPATSVSASKSTPPSEPKPSELKGLYLQQLIYPQAFRILYVKEQQGFADRLRNYLASKGYKTTTVYDDFSEITQDSRQKPGTIRIVYKSTFEVFEPTLSGLMRDKFPSETGRLVKSLNDTAASDLQIQLW